MGYQYHLDGDGWSSMTYSTSMTYPGISEGVHTVYVRATDNATNSIVSSLSFTIDRTVPTLVIDQPVGGIITNASSMTVSVTGEDVGSGVQGYQYQLDEGTWSALTDSPEVSYQDMTEGAHTVHVRVIDEAGNSATASVPFIVDTVSPTLNHKFTLHQRVPEHLIGDRFHHWKRRGHRGPRLPIQTGRRRMVRLPVHYS